MTESEHTPLTPVVFHILLAIADGHTHGYAIGLAVEEVSGLRMGPGTLYGSLQRMERDGLVEEVEDPDEERRKPFVLTGEGRRTLEAEAARIDRLARLVRARHLLESQDLATGADGA